VRVDRVVARSGVGVDNLNAPLPMSAGICGFNVPDYCGDEVSTRSLALLLALERQVSLQDRLIRANAWGIYRGGLPRRTAVRSAGIVGFGRIGRATSRKPQPFYQRAYTYDPHVPADVAAGRGGRLVDPAAVLDALEAGRLGGFGSDVFSPEDPNASPVTRALLERDDVLVSSHA